MALLRKRISDKEMNGWLQKMDLILDSNFVFNGDGPNEIIPGFLWLGDSEDAQNMEMLQKLGIQCILNCAGNDISIAYPSTMRMRVHRFSANDHQQYDLIGQHLAECLSFIDGCRENGDRILVHCVAGMNRSATITVAYLMHHFDGMHLLEAVQYTVKRRCWILTNKGFRRQLIQYAFDRDKLSLSASLTKSKL